MNIKEKFNLEKASIFKAVKMDKNPLFKRAGFLKVIFFILFIVGLVTLLLSIIGIIEVDFNNLIIGLILLSLSLFILFFQIEYFFEIKMKHPKVDICLSDIAENIEVYNLAGIFSFKVARALHKTKINRGEGLSVFLYHLLNDPDFNFIFSRLRISLIDIRGELKNRKDENQELLWEVIEESIYETLSRDGKRVKKNDVLVSACNHHLLLKSLLVNNQIEIQDIRNLSNWIYRTKTSLSDRKKFWKWRNLIKRGSLAKDWASGYTILLDRFSTNWTNVFKKNGFPEMIGHKEEIKVMERTLSRGKNNNVILVGEPGTGRKSMIYDLARKSFYGETLSEINHKRVVELDLVFLLSNIDAREEIESTLQRIFSEVVRSGNTILVINDIHNFIGGDNRPGTIDISGIIGQYLSHSGFQIIGITDHSGYRRSIEESSLVSSFEKIEVIEISKIETIRVLQNITMGFEYKYRKMISYPAIKETVNYCEKYLPSEPFPRKAINILDEAMTFLIQTKENVLLPEHIAGLISRKTNIPIGTMKDEEKDVLMNLEDLIHQKVINQKEAVKEISSAIRRSRAEISSKNKPMGTFLFLGPSGVGKTETAKTLSEVYFKSPKKLIRIDMSEFQSINDIPRLIGSLEYEGVLTTKIKEEPFSLLLLDEIEKAHPDILNLFLQILDEGYITDGMGRKINFKNSIIIATSNAGANMILKNIIEKTEWELLKEGLLNHLFSEGIFRPEFINRFDSVVLFSPLSKDNLLDITQLSLNKIVKRLKERNIEFLITEDLKEKIVEIGYNEIFGAREIKRVIQDKVENVLASSFISNKINKGDKIKINSETFEIELLD